MCENKSVDELIRLQTELNRVLVSKYTRLAELEKEIDLLFEISTADPDNIEKDRQYTAKSDQGLALQDEIDALERYQKQVCSFI